MDLIGYHQYDGTEIDSEIDLIEDRLYLGSLVGARDENELRSKGITHILAALESFEGYQKLEGFEYMQIVLDDSFDVDVLGCLPRAFTFITQAMKTGKVFVHCAMGISRSATIVTSYLMVKYSISIIEAIKIVRKGRPGAHPNANFQNQISAIDVNSFKCYLE